MTLSAPWSHSHPHPVPLDGGCVAALGTFDGVHAGHRALLATAAAEAHHFNVPLVAVTFDPHPRQVLRPETPLRLLLSLAERVQALHAAGAQGVAIIPFTRELAAQSPASFMHTYLEGWLRARTVVVGENFRFGHKAAGTPATLQANPAFTTRIVPLLADAHGPLSSSRLRAERHSSLAPERN